ncbi:pectate lyase [Haloarcula mannanilytica]|uniref:Pectate lyase n=1 Tax=Haloarcula mannanilytica TaxID=2509225 RepID=A0A4C2ETE9_9EURY|nr:pectate lyase [Haloarcula mannanilytica]GCF15873.1 pectate lyase [Haloarcula mannanilytica]
MSVPSASELIDGVQLHADTVLEHARDDYGDESTPLLVDALDATTRAGVKYDGRDVADGYLSNVALQQSFLRALVGLSEITNDETYRSKAEDIISWTFEHATDDIGLVYWGGHAAYDLEADEVVVGKSDHELKFEYPFYELLYDVSPDATRQFVKAFWNAHVLDWDSLDFNRHGGWNEPIGTLWDHEYEGGDVFFWGDGLTFVNTGSDLYYAAGVLADLTGEDEPLAWAKRLAHRYVETRQDPGISGYQFSQHASYCNGPEIRGDRAQYQFAPYIHGDHRIFEGTLFRPRPIVQRQQLALAGRLDERGAAFAQWAVEELRAWREAAYRPSDNEFAPMLTDGLSLEGFVIRREGYFGPKGRVIGPIEAGPGFLWAYARAYRIVGDDLCYATARDIVAGIGLGDIGAPEESPSLGFDVGPEAVGPELLSGLLELYRASGDDTYLDAAASIGGRLLDERENGLFTDTRGLAVLDNPTPLALLRLAAALRGGPLDTLPVAVGNRQSPKGGI